MFGRLRHLTRGAMAAVVIVGPGSVRALHTGLALAGKGATVLQFTATAPDEEMTIKPHDLYFNDTRFITSYSCGPDDTRQALELVERGVLSASALVTHSFPLAQVSEAFATAQRQDALKVVVTFGQ